MKGLRKSYIGEQPRRRDRLIKERTHDPYKTRLKLPEPTVCPRCSATWHAGRWQWLEHQPENANEELCQACHRINDRYPAGELALRGSFLKAHEEEILHLIRNTEKAENQDHPLHRIISIDRTEDGFLVTTTDLHLPRRIGQAIYNAYEGEFDFNYDEEGYFVRANWRRERKT